MAERTDEEVWAEVQKRLPTHDCGRRMLPGGTPELGHMLVCPPCSHIAAVDQDWVDQLVAQVREEAPRG